MSTTAFCFKPQETFKRLPKPPLRTRRTNDNRNTYPIPRGDTPYARAKRAEYIDRNLAKAEFFYKQAIRQNDRADSSVKDLAGILHQQGRTTEACRLLEENKHLFSADQSKFENLLQNLQRQVTPSGNCLNKALKVSGLEPADSAADVCKLFQNSTRIQSIALGKELIDLRQNWYAMLKFTSHSAARKTLESFHNWEKYKVDWVSVTGEVVGDACHNKDKLADFKRVAPIAFCYSLFLQDPRSYLYALPVDSQSMPASPSKTSDQEMETFVGKSLLSYILNMPA
jgi:tetratricopeptide (TPR) repeat protein